jgi:hypothetical protein
MKKFALMTLVILLVLSAVSFGGLQRKLWWDTPTSSIDEAWAVINGDTEPDVVDIVGDATSGDQGVDNYVGSFSGALMVPADGDYTFYVASDDDSQLLLDGAVVAYVSGWTGNQDWASGSAHPSAPMSLTAGQLLAVDMAFREGGGGDHFSIGWLTPDSTEIVLLPDAVTYPSRDNWPNTPVPASAATNVVEGMLSWQAPTGVENPTYTVAFGTDPSALAVVAEGLTEPVYDAGMLGTELGFSTTYYWKATVDGGDGTGFLWSFTTADPVIINSVSGDAQPVGAAAQLSVDAVSPLGAELSYQWHRLNVELPGGIVIPDAPIPGADSAVHEIEAISTADEGSYYVVVSCVDGEIASSVVILDAQTGLIHRWSFGDSVDGVTLPDSVGGTDATLINNTGLATVADGQVNLGNDGSQSSNGNNGDASGDYVDLPNGLVSSLTQMTIEVWTTWNNDTQTWARVYDFGTSNSGEGLSSAADAGGDVYNFYFSTKRWDGLALVEYRHGGNAPSIVPGGTLALGEETLITQVHDDKADQVRLYVNGIAVGGYEPPFALQKMTDNNNWLGRSQWGDTLYVGSFNELRIYDTVLSGEEIAANYLAGPDELGQLPEPSGGAAAIGDLNGDGVYDLLDMAIAADKWLTSLLNEQAKE